MKGILSASSAMIPLRAAALYTAGLLVAFTAGRMSMPAPAMGTAGQGADAGNRRTGLPASLAGRSVGTAGETWLDVAAADAAAVRGAALPGEANQVLLEKLGAVLGMNDPVERVARWSELMPLMRMEDAGAIRAVLRAISSEGRGFDLEAAAFWQRCGRMDPVTALTWCAEDGGMAAPAVLSGWASRDSAAALAWFKAHPGEEDLWPGMALTGLVRGLATQSPEGAVELLLANGDDPLFSPCLGMATDLVTQQRGITAALQWFNEVAESDAPAPFKTANLKKLLSYRDLGAGSRRTELFQTLARYAGEPWFSPAAANDLGEYAGELDPVEGAEVMERFQSAEAKEYFMETFLKQWLETDAGSVGNWLERNRASSSFDAVALQLVRHLADKDPKEARRWAAQINDPVQREALEKELAQDPGN